jgi:hypothetical protein
MLMEWVRIIAKGFLVWRRMLTKDSGFDEDSGNVSRGRG